MGKFRPEMIKVCMQLGYPDESGVKLEDGLEAYINAPTDLKYKISDSLTNQLVKTLTGIADIAWKEFEYDKLTDEKIELMLNNWLENQLEYVIKYRPKNKVITCGNLSIFWDRIVRCRINLIKKKHTKHGKSKLIKFKTTIRMRDV